MAPVTYPRRLHDLATESPDTVALTVVTPGGASVAYTRSELDHRAAALARALQARGVGTDTLVVLALPNGVEVVLGAYATWWLGGCIMPLSTTLAPTERDEVLRAAAESGRVIVTIASGTTAIDGALTIDALLAESDPLPGGPLTAPDADIISFPGRALPSGGSTGRPKIIVDTRPLQAEPDVTNPLSELLGRRPGQTTLVVGPVYHALPFGSVFGTLFERGHVVLMTRFEPSAALDAIEQHRVNVLSTVPIHLQRMAGVPGIETRNLGSIESLYHSGAACPDWLKRRWLELVGPEQMYEGFGSTEAVGMLVIRGDEWLAHPGTVGRGVTTEVSVRAPDGQDQPTGEVGEIFMRWRPADGPIGSSLQGATYRYWGTDAPAAPDGFVSVGDLGWLDADGYLFVADRRTDMIITGGVNVYPAEVEAALSEHPDLDDAVVIGLPDDEWGRRVHAVIVPRERTADEQALVDELDGWCRSRLSSAKRPKTYELVTALDRNEAGKVRRSRMAAQRAESVESYYTPDPERRSRVD